MAAQDCWLCYPSLYFGEYLLPSKTNQKKSFTLI
jgi:hypothetical protein